MKAYRKTHPAMVRAAGWTALAASTRVFDLPFVLRYKLARSRV